MSLVYVVCVGAARGVWLPSSTDQGAVSDCWICREEASAGDRATAGLSEKTSIPHWVPATREREEKRRETRETVRERMRVCEIFQLETVSCSLRTSDLLSTQSGSKVSQLLQKNAIIFRNLYFLQSEVLTVQTTSVSVLLGPNHL